MTATNQVMTVDVMWPAVRLMEKKVCEIRTDGVRGAPDWWETYSSHCDVTPDDPSYWSSLDLHAALANYCASVRLSPPL